MDTTNKYSILRSFLAQSRFEDFKSWLEKVDPARLDFWFLLSLLGGGSYDVTCKACMLLDLVDPKDYDYDALLYFRYRPEADSRAFRHFDELIAKVSEENKKNKGLEAFQ